MNECIVGFDGSEHSRVALRWAASLASTISLKLVAVEAWHGGDPAAAEARADGVRENLARVARQELGSLADQVDITFEALQGSDAGAILERVTPDSVLVLGSRGRGGFSALLLGSVSRECVEHARCPVMIVRHERSVPGPENPILVGHDGSSNSVGVLQWAAALGQLTGAEVIAAHVWQARASEVRPRMQQNLSSSASQNIETWARDVGPGVRPLEIEGEPRMALVEAAPRLNAGLLAAGRRGGDGIRALRIGSVASYLVRNSTVPIAIVPPPPETEPA
jgi:nucleotide-binding universal stress UspA family protein